MQIFFHLKLILSVLYYTQITLLLQQKLNNKEENAAHKNNHYCIRRNLAYKVGNLKNNFIPFYYIPSYPDIFDNTW